MKSYPSVSVFLVSLLTIVSFPPSDALAGPQKRLIQLDQNQRLWMGEDQIRELKSRLHAEGTCGGFMDVTEHPNKTPNRLLEYSALTDRIPSHSDVVNDLISRLSSDNLLATVVHLSSYPNRYYASQTGVEASDWLRDQFIALSGARKDIVIGQVRHAFPQPSVIARIQGNGIHSAERVIVGAHLDSINWSNKNPGSQDPAPGADDDASGISILLETFRILVETGFHPDRTIEFIAYAGEERGLLGSQDIAEQYKKKGIPVAGVLQLDMTFFPGASPTLVLINDHIDPALNQFTKMLIDTYVKIPWKEGACRYACSDHASWTAAGYPAVFPFEAPHGQFNPKIHTAGDTVDQLSPLFGLNFAKLAMAFAIEIAEPTDLPSSALSALTSDDSDLSPPVQKFLPDADPGRSDILHPDNMEITPAGSGITVDLLRMSRGNWTPVSGLEFQLANGSKVTADDNGLIKLESCNSPVLFEASLIQTKFSIRNSAGVYRLSFEVPCNSHAKVQFDSDTQAGQALGIWQIAEKAKTKLSAAVGLDFWKKQIEFYWPDNGDYYGFNQIHISEGHKWDIVGHELGHAIFHQAGIGQFGGGSHKIDDCYTDTLAFSEGWASYFSAWLSVDLADPDARFEYLVPRRAPIRFENVPADVCKGPANEWRVTSFFWDLIDFHEDTETATQAFAKVWASLQGSQTGSAAAAVLRMRKSGITPELLDLVWSLNFQTPQPVSEKSDQGL